ncbi:MAG: ribonuclease HIII [Aquificae bacterium]|nr:ribonuclease HIII [Aquificota bacterium]
MNKVLKFPKEFAPLFEEKLRALGLQREENDGVVFAYRGGGLKVVFYPTGTLLIQGKGDLEAFAEKLVSDLPLEVDYIGTDEAGKGDLFGPLVVCGFALTAKVAKEVLKLGVRDSKSVPPDSLEKMAEALMRLGVHRCVVVMPEAYNEVYKKLQNLNKVLSLGHSAVIDALFLETALSRAVVDKFMKGSYLDCFVNAPVEVREETKAERYPAVAAASLIARYLYLKKLEELSKLVGMRLPPGSGAEAKRVFQELRAKFDARVLKKVAKLHFKV